MEKEAEDNFFDFSKPLDFFGKQIQNTELSERLQDAKVKEYPDKIYYAWPQEGFTVVTTKKKSAKENEKNDKNG